MGYAPPTCRASRSARHGGCGRGALGPRRLPGEQRRASSWTRQLKNMTDEQFDNVIDINLKGVYNCTRAVVDTMLESSNRA